MFRLTFKRTLQLGARRYSSIPFDSKPFPFHRFEPCCPEADVKPAPNGYVPCKTHPIPDALGKKIELTEPMSRPDSLRHLVGCVGYEADEWTRSHCNTVPGIMQSLEETNVKWLKTNTPDGKFNKQILVTVAEREPMDGKRPDVMLFPEFKMIPSIDISQGLISETSSLYPVIDSVWNNPNNALPEGIQWQDIEADTVVLVCTHGRRDLRCGYLGPPIVTEFNKQAKSMGIKLEAWGTCHFGGKA